MLTHSFFIKLPYQHNKINTLLIDTTTITNDKDIAKHAFNHFRGILGQTGSTWATMSSDLWSDQEKVTLEENIQLTSSFTISEI